MKSRTLLLLLLDTLARFARAATLYVDAGSTNAVAPYASLATAARDIQAAVYAAVAGDTIWVADGVYATGGQTVDFDQPCRVVAAKAIVIRSVNGPEVTRIVGSPFVHLQPNSVRCVFLNGAVLDGFTLQGGALIGPDKSGGGAYLLGSAELRNCVLLDNQAGLSGGGVFGGKAINCRFIRNRAPRGGAAAESTLRGCLLAWNEASGDGGATDQCEVVNCTVRYNRATGFGGGVHGGQLRNSIVWQNTGTAGGANAHNLAAASFSIVEGDSLPAGEGNSQGDPGLSANHRISPGSPAYHAGSADFSEGVDVDGDAWSAPNPSIGCDEPEDSGARAPTLSLLAPARLYLGQSVAIHGLLSQPASAIRLDLGDGTVEPSTGFRHHLYGSTGIFQVVATAFTPGIPGGMSITQAVEVLPNVFYVSADTGADGNDGLGWATAKRTLQAAVNASQPMGSVWVTNGVYASGSARTPGSYTPSRVSTPHPLHIRSVNGPMNTFIVGDREAVDTSGAIRCAYLQDSVLEGFTLQHGGADFSNGGGALMVGPNALLKNCIVRDNHASNPSFQGSGGGMHGGRAENCIFAFNSAFWGGGCANADLRGCLVVGNQGFAGGGGLNGFSAVHCTIVGNSGNMAGGAFAASLLNCIVWGNTGGVEGGNSNVYYCVANHSHVGAAVVPAGQGNSIADPRFVGVWHLGPDSPCLGTGLADGALGLDLDGESWRAPPSRGCDERPVSASVPDTPLLVASGATLLHQDMLLLPRVSPQTTRFRVSFGDGSYADNQDFLLHRWAEPGLYDVVVTAYGPGFEGGLSSTQRVDVADTRIYVSAETGNDAWDGRSWATAKRTIQAGVDAQILFDADVVVSNGVYSAGGSPILHYGTPARVTLNRRINLRSVNGPALTRIMGGAYAQGSPMRCLMMNAGTCEGFSLEHGSAGTGAGAYLESDATLRNCVLRFNSSEEVGGGAGGRGTLENCLLTANRATLHGGGAVDVTLWNCAVHGNWAGLGGGGLFQCIGYNTTVRDNACDASEGGGGVRESYMLNSIVWGNWAANLPHQAHLGAFSHCCVQDLIPPGEGNIRDDPLFSGPYHLNPASPCAAAGSPDHASGFDIDGTPWGAAPAMGCDLPLAPAGTPVVSLRVARRVLLGQSIPLEVACPTPHDTVRLDYGDGERETRDAAVWFTHAWREPGIVSIVAEVSGGGLSTPLRSTQTVEVVDTRVFVSARDGDDGNDGLSWATAKRTLQAGVDAQTQIEGIVLVEEGVYNQGVRTVAADGQPTRLVIEKPVTVLSLRGPFRTHLVGEPHRQGTAAAVRGAYLGMGTLEGFSVLHGGTRSGSTARAAGVQMTGANASIRNCIVMDNQDCGIFGGSAWNSFLLRNGNPASNCGGAYYSDLSNCLVAYNLGTFAAGVYGGNLTHCTVRFNLGIGIAYGTAVSSILWDNFGGGTSSNAYETVFHYSDVGGANGTGTGNVALLPRFESLFRLAPDSPCVGAGRPGSTPSSDWEGDERPVRPSMGCDEPHSAGQAPLLHAPFEIGTGVPGTVMVIVPPGATRWSVDYGDGSAVGRGEITTHTWLEPGAFPVVATVHTSSHPAGISVTQLVSVVDNRVYVSSTGDDGSSGRSLAEAKRTIQAGVNAQTNAYGLVLVDDGVYDTGGVAPSGQTAIRVQTTSSVHIRSRNGAARTRIVGAPFAAKSAQAVRCVQLTASTLDGFTVEHGACVSSSEDGGGILADDSSRVLNCILRDNRAGQGGAVKGGILENCILLANRAELSGGGAYASRLINCAILGNSAQSGGGLYDCVSVHCTIRNNFASLEGGGMNKGLCGNGIVWDNISQFSVSSNLYEVAISGTDAGAVAIPGPGNLSVPPRFDGLFRLSADSPCLGAGLPGQAVRTDLDGEIRPTPPAMGCDEPGALVASQLLAPLEEAGTGQPVSFLVLPAQGTSRVRMDFGDGSTPSDGPVQSHAWLLPGIYTVIVDILPSGERFSHTIRILDNRVYVDAAGGNDAWDGRTPATAKRTIQAGVDAQTIPHGLVLVAPGLYAEGGRNAPEYPNAPTRVVTTRAVHIRSIQGPFETRLRGSPLSYLTPNAVRGVYLTDSILEGFLLEDFSLRTNWEAGAGAYLQGASLLRNCLLWNNRAGGSGGGVHGGRLENCLLVNNHAGVGGGAYKCSVSGGVALRNHANFGGAFSYCSLTNTTLRANTASALGGGANDCSLLNCLSWHNQVGSTASDGHSVTARYSNFGDGVQAGPGNVSQDPLFSGSHHLSPHSPALGAGLGGAVSGLDWDGDPWTEPPPMGADSPSGTRPLEIRLLIGTDPRTTMGTPILVLANQATSGIELDFGDGSPFSGEYFSTHPYASPGDYTVVARVFTESFPQGMAVTQRVTVTDALIHVSAQHGNDANDGRSWPNAKRTIQAGVDAQTIEGGTVLVGDGIYNFGTTRADGHANRVVVDRPMRVVSVNGPGASRIQGLPWPGGNSSSVRGVYLKDAVLEGFTIEHCGGTSSFTDGGGVYMAGNALIRNCVVALNRGYEGGGIHGGQADSCWIVGNSGQFGGGAANTRLANCLVLRNQAGNHGGGLYGGSASNCTVRLNSASWSGGAYTSTLVNSIVWDNTGGTASNHYEVSSSYSCLGGPLPGGSGNRAANPRIFSLYRLSPDSPCLAAGQPGSGAGFDLDGDPWGAPPSIGCDEPMGLGPEALPTLRMIAPALAERGVTAPLLLTSSHPTTSLSLDYGDGFSELSDGYTTHAWNLPGEYWITVTATVEGVPAPTVLRQSVRVLDDTRYVSALTGLDTQDGRSWATAKKTLQAGVDAQLRPGGMVVVTNGVYNTGGRASDYFTTLNRLFAPRDVYIRSVNGPSVTIIEGAPSSSGGNGRGAVRPVYLEAGRLEGFTLRRGFSDTLANDSQRGHGGGAWLGPAAILASCVVTNNTARWAGGGVYGGTVINCLLAGNAAPSGAGAFTSVVSRCTVAGNTASTAGGGVYSGVVDNSVVAGNLAPVDPNLAFSTATFSLSPGLGGPGNLDATPLFVDPAALNFRLRADSPGLDAASPLGAPALDLDRLPRQVGPAPDLGAYEYAASSSDSDSDGMVDAWESAHALDLFNPADAGQNPDADAHSNLEEFIAGSLPHDPSSQFRLWMAPAQPGQAPVIAVTGLAGRAYTLEYSDSPATGSWLPVPGLVPLRPTGDGTVHFTDPSPQPGRFYRVRVGR